MMGDPENRVTVRLKRASRLNGSGRTIALSNHNSKC